LAPIIRILQFAFAAALGCLNPLGEIYAQGEIIVDASGNGDYTELQPAIDAAAPWQIIRVKHGSYAGATITKSVRILGDPYQFKNAFEVSAIEIRSPIFIRNLPKGVPVVIADLSADPVGKFQDFDDLIDAKNCGGAIHLAFTAAGDVLLDNCAYVTINDHHGGGRLRAVRSTVVTSYCSISEWEGPTIDLYDSTFIASRLVTGPSKPGDPAVRVDGGSRFIADFHSSIVGGGLGVPAFEIIDGTVDESILDYLVFNGNDRLPPLDQSVDSLVLELGPFVSGNVQAEAIVAGLPVYPFATPSGELFLDPGNSALLHLGLGLTGEKTRVHLPKILKPSRYFDLDPPASRLALPDARLQGIPVVFQGALLIDGVAKYTLPYIIVL
jgi:hypothetical protein